MFRREFLTSSSEESSSDVEDYAPPDLPQESEVVEASGCLPTMQNRKELLQAQRHRLTRACQIVVSINDGVPQHPRPVRPPAKKQPEDMLEEVKLVDVAPALSLDSAPARLNWFEESPRSASTEDLPIVQEFPAKPEPRACLAPSPEPPQAVIPLSPVAQALPQLDSMLQTNSPKASMFPTTSEQTPPQLTRLPVAKPQMQTKPRTAAEHIRSHIHQFKTLLLSPLTSGLWFRCTLKRDKSSLSKKLWARYHLFLNENWVFLLGACKRRWNKSANYMITNSLDRFHKNSDSYLGKVRKQGDRYVVYDSGARPSAKHAGHVRRELASLNLGSGAQNYLRAASALLPIKPALQSLEDLFRQGEPVEALVGVAVSQAEGKF